MSDFFSFEYFDDEPLVASEDPNDHRTTYRKNQSLSAASAEFLRTAINRLVPTSFVYGDTGIGNRSYELYGLCVSHAFTGRKGNLLVACLCVMHATYERRSQLVILPSDIEVKFADLKIPGLRTTNILKYYDEMCQKLHLPRLEPSIERLFERILRDACRINSEQVINQILETGIRIEKELRTFTNVLPKNQGGNRRKNYTNIWKIETIAATAILLACRVHRIQQASLPDIAKEVNLDKSSISYLITRYRNAMDERAESEVPVDRESPEANTPKGEKEQEPENVAKKKRRMLPLRIAGLEVPSGLTLSVRSSGRSKETKNEDVLRIVRHDGRPGGDPLDFINDGEIVPAYQRLSYVAFELPDGLGYEPIKSEPIPADVPPLPLEELEEEPDVPPLPPYMVSESKKSTKSDLVERTKEPDSHTYANADLDDFLDLLSSGPTKGEQTQIDAHYDEYWEDEQEYD